jgi:hypothetical protein
MPAGGSDLANLYTWSLQIAPQQLTATGTGTGVDFRDCGPEVTVIEAIGVNPGNDTTIDTKLQHSSDNSTFADVSGATFTQVAGDTENQVTVQTFFNRARRYCRAVVTIAGTSPTPMVCVVICARETSF